MMHPGVIFLSRRLSAYGLAKISRITFFEAEHSLMNFRACAEMPYGLPPQMDVF
jgi:hypothetical protein